MRNNANKSGDTPQKWLAKVTMSSAYLFLIALLCVAYLREQADQHNRRESVRVQWLEDADAKYTDFTLVQMYGGMVCLSHKFGAAHVANDESALATYDLKSNTLEYSTIAQLEGLYRRISMKEG